MIMFRKTPVMPDKENALPGRDQALEISGVHHVNGRSILPPFPDDCLTLDIGMGCFWGAEKLFWKLEGVLATAVGYAGGFTVNPFYEEVCSGQTGHTEAVRLIYQPKIISLQKLLTLFWEEHDPTQGMRQGHDIGTQYRSVIYYPLETQKDEVLQSRDRYQLALDQKGYPAITTEIQKAGPFYYAEEYHQQYLAKNPNGYCGLAGTGVSCR